MFGEFHHLYSELRDNENLFYAYTRMSTTTFYLYIFYEICSTILVVFGPPKSIIPYYIYFIK